MADGPVPDPELLSVRGSAVIYLLLDVRDIDLHPDASEPGAVLAAAARFGLQVPAGREAHHAGTAAAQGSAHPADPASKLLLPGEAQTGSGRMCAGGLLQFVLGGLPGQPVPKACDRAESFLDRGLQPADLPHHPQPSPGQEAVHHRQGLLHHVRVFPLLRLLVLPA